MTKFVSASVVKLRGDNAVGAQRDGVAAGLAPDVRQRPSQVAGGDDRAIQRHRVFESHIVEVRRDREGPRVGRWWQGR